MSSPDPTAAGGDIVWAQDATGPLLRFSGTVDRDAVRRFRLLVPPSSWPARVDLAEVAAMDPAGLELLVLLARKPRRRGGELEVLAVPAALRPELARAGLAQLLPHPDSTPTSA